jgi:hypothetical protein
MANRPINEFDETTLFFIGAERWPGLTKVVEECGEVLQNAGKILAFPDEPHPSGTVPGADFWDEVADLTAALEYMAAHNPVNAERFKRRADAKRRLFEQWHAEERARLSS